MKTRGYIEWVNPNTGVGIITNSFRRVLYITSDYDNNAYERWTGKTVTLTELIGKDHHFKSIRNLTKDELMLELI